MAKPPAGGKMAGGKGKGFKGSSPKGSSPLGIRGGERNMKVRVKASAQRTPSQQRWLERQLNDPYVAAAQRDGLRSRAAFKLMEIDDRHRLLKPGQRIIDLGAAPGGWTQIAVDRVKALDGRGQVIAIDYLAIGSIAGATILELDFLDDSAPDQLKALMRDGGADVVLSDMASPTTGHSSTDHLRIVALAEAAALFAREVLAPGGAFLCKMFQGGTERELLADLRKDFAVVRHIKPPASRKESTELYMLATGFRGRV